VVKSAVEQAGFLVHLQDFHTATAMPYLTPGFGLKLMVADEDYHAAREMLESIRAEHKEATADAASIDECPTCGSGDVVRFRSVFWFPLLWVMGRLVAAPGGNMRHCRNCHTAYKTEGPAITRPMKTAIAVFILLVLLILPAT
jgi:hypothetical protein